MENIRTQSVSQVTYLPFHCTLLVKIRSAKTKGGCMTKIASRIRCGIFLLASDKANSDV